MTGNPDGKIPVHCVFQPVEGARGIEPPPRFSDEAGGFEDRGVPSTIAPVYRFSLMHLLAEPLSVE